MCLICYGCKIIESNLTLKLAGPKPSKLQLAITPSFLIGSLWFQAHFERSEKTLLCIFLMFCGWLIWKSYQLWKVARYI